jgi:protein-disulfide isomerase
MTTLSFPVEKQDHRRGNPQAAVTLVEYGDYECNHCGDAYSVIKQVEAEAGDRMQFVFRNFPLSQTHRHALHAALAAEAAGLQDQFWTMHDLIFENQDRLTDEDLVGYAEKLGLDVDRFERDMQSEAIAQKVKADFNSGVRSGVGGTPTFFINGQRFEGAAEYDELLDAIYQAEKE